MTVTRVNSMPNPEPEVPITDPRWLVSTQPDPTPDLASLLGRENRFSGVA